MTYHFFFERKKLILLFLLLALAGVVLFLAGLLIGMNLGPTGAVPSLDPKAPAESPPNSGVSQAPPSEKPNSSSDRSIESEDASTGAAAGESAGVDPAGNSSSVLGTDEGGSGASGSNPSVESEGGRVAKGARQDSGEASSKPEARSARSGSTSGEGTGDTEVFELQLSQVRSAAEADREVERWRRIGFAPYVVAVRNGGGERRFTVRIGPFASREKALEEQRRLAQGEGHESVLRFRRAAFGPIPNGAASPS